MKNYRNAVAALLLAFVFATPAFAEDGIMYTDLTPPVPAEEVVASPVPAEEDTVTEIALDLLQTLLTLI